MTGSGAQPFERWRGVDAVVAGYAGTSAGCDAFATAVAELRRALPAVRIWLLRPEDVPSAGAGGDEDRVIAYPDPHADPDRDAAALRRAFRAVDALIASRADAALIFTERGSAPYAPAYLCYLAGIGFRAGIESEFSGAVLSPAVRVAAEFDDVGRHLALLELVGIGSGASRADTHGAAAVTSPRST